MMQVQQSCWQPWCKLVQQSCWQPWCKCNRVADGALMQVQENCWLSHAQQGLMSVVSHGTVHHPVLSGSCQSRMVYLTTTQFLWPVVCSVLWLSAVSGHLCLVFRWARYVCFLLSEMFYFSSLSLSCFEFLNWIVCVSRFHESGAWRTVNVWLWVWSCFVRPCWRWGV